MNRIQISVGRQLFEFKSFRDWLENGRKRYEQYRVTHANVIAVDSLGRLCVTGRQWKFADTDQAFPVTIYALEPEEGTTGVAA